MSRPSSATSQEDSVEISRRQLFQSIVKAGVTSAAASLILGGASAAASAASVPSPEELARLQNGYARVQYLLKNWDDVTSVCGKAIMSDTERKQVIRTEGGGGGEGICEKTPLRVQEFMGYKSTTDPLYKADKLMVRAAPLVDPDNFESYLDVVERYREKADQTAMMAYTSSWGEANPNGGKEVIDDYLDKTKADVVESEKLLKQVLAYLELPQLPPLTGKL